MNAQEWLDRADALAAEATEGPWALVLAWDSEYGTNYGVDGAPIEDPCRVMRGGMEEDAEFIAASRALVPAMSAALRAVLKACDDSDAAEYYRGILITVIRQLITDALVGAS